MNLKHFLHIVFLFFIIGCAPWKESLKTSTDYEDAVNNAIIDYLHTSKINREFNVFHVFTVIKEEIIGIGINGDNGKWMMGKVKIGEKNEYFPSRYKEIGGKLFYWSDSDVAITTDLIDIMKKYKILDTITYPENIIPETNGLYSEGSIDYYFCKSNFLKYKKVKSKIAIGYYIPPKMNCD